ncbi:MAG: hypothetical protein LBT35_06320, partial [Tannerella sp.]|nr:hypothetical protein [Tannerella sp.]
MKRTVIICIIPVSVALAAAALILLPPVQRFAVRKVTVIASEALGVNITVESVRLSLPLNLAARHATVTGQDGDTLLYLKRMTLHVRRAPLFRGIISVKGASLDGVDIDSRDMIEGLRVRGHADDIYLSADSVDVANSVASLRNIRMADAEIEVFICDGSEAAEEARRAAESSESTEEVAGNAAEAEDSVAEAVSDSASSVLWMIDIRRAELENVSLSCHTNCDSTVIRTTVSEAVLTDAFADLGRGLYRARNLKVELDELYFDDVFEAPVQGLDLAHLHVSGAALDVDSIH